MNEDYLQQKLVYEEGRLLDEAVSTSRVGSGSGRGVHSRECVLWKANESCSLEYLMCVNCGVSALLILQKQGVMMGWEKPLMIEHAKVICRKVDRYPIIVIAIALPLYLSTSLPQSVGRTYPKHWFWPWSDRRRN